MSKLSTAQLDSAFRPATVEEKLVRIANLKASLQLFPWTQSEWRSIQSHLDCMKREIENASTLIPAGT